MLENRLGAKGSGDIAVVKGDSFHSLIHLFIHFKHVLSISSVSFRSIVKKCVHVSDDNVINTVEKNKEEIDARTEEVGVTSLPIKPFGD